MDLDIVNPHVIRILVAVREEDSINSISKRINLSYGWTHKWVQELANKRVLKLTRMRVYLNKTAEFYKKTLQYIKRTFSFNVQFHYEFLSLLGVQYCFTETDSVFVWTKGGYNIGRYKQFYPIFIKVKKSDKILFEWYCNKIGLKINKKQGVFYKVEYMDSFEIEYCENIPVDPLNKTISFAQKNIYNFEPALEMIKEMYHKKIKVEYKEALTNV
ncbi:hypothetical protein HY837_01725 [archaeon]|nr:hypothetical protein [archaeon]